MKSVLKISALKKVLLSYLALLIVPLICFSLLINDFYHRYVVNGIVEEYQLSGARNAEELAGMLASLQQTSKDVKLQKIFYKEYAQEMPVVFIDIRNYLKKAEASLHLNSTLYFCDLTTDEIHTSRGVYHFIPFVQEIIAQNKNMRVPRTILNDYGVNYVMPIEFQKSGALASIMIYTVSPSYFESILRYAQSYSSTVSVVRYQDRTLYQTGTLPEPDPMDQLYYRAASGTKDGFTIENYISKREMRRDTNYPLRVLAICILSMLVLGITVIFHMLRKNYLPLQNSLLRLLLECNQPGTVRDLSALDEAVSKILTHRQSLLTQNIQINKEYVLYRLLTGKPDVANHLDSVNLPGPCYLCVVATPASLSLLKDTQPVAVETVALDDTSGCAVLSGGMHVLADVVSKLLEQGILGPLACAGVGSVVPALSDINESFLRAKLARSEALRLRQSAAVVKEEALPWDKGADAGFTYPYDLFDSLDAACRTGNLERIAYYTEVIKISVQDASNRFVAACLFQDYLKTVAAGMASLKFPGFQETALRDLYYGKPLHKKEELCDNMSDILINLTKLLASSSTGVRPAATCGQIEDYIREHYLDPNFSIKLMSYDLQTSQSNLCHIFKKDKGITITEYIDRQKLEYGKSLMAASGRSVSEISAMLGFAGPSTFIRKFKQYEGITPGEYKQTLSR